MSKLWVWVGNAVVVGLATAVIALAKFEESKKPPATPNAVRRCKLTQHTDRYGKTGWTTEGILVGSDEKVILSKLLPLPWPATRKEAWKACERWLDEKVKR